MEVFITIKNVVFSYGCNYVEGKIIKGAVKVGENYLGYNTWTNFSVRCLGVLRKNDSEPNQWIYSDEAQAGEAVRLKIGARECEKLKNAKFIFNEQTQLHSKFLLHTEYSDKEKEAVSMVLKQNSYWMANFPTLEISMVCGIKLVNNNIQIETISPIWVPKNDEVIIQQPYTHKEWLRSKIRD